MIDPFSEQKYEPVLLQDLHSITDVYPKDLDRKVSGGKGSGNNFSAPNLISFKAENSFTTLNSDACRHLAIIHTTTFATYLDIRGSFSEDSL